MIAPTDLDHLTDFFDRYGSALTRGDVSAVANCYALPGESYRYVIRSDAHGPRITTVITTH